MVTYVKPEVFGFWADVYIKSECLGKRAYGKDVKSAIDSLAAEYCNECGVDWNDLYIEAVDYDYSTGGMHMIWDGHNFYSARYPDNEEV